MDVGFDGGNVGLHQREAPRQVLDAPQRRRWLGVLAGGFADGFGELGRQRGFQHQHRHTGPQVSARDLQAVGRVGVDQHAALTPGLADGGQSVGMGAAAGDEAETARALARGRCKFRGIQREPAGLGQRGTEQLGRARTVAAQQVEHEAFEVAGLADVHAGAGGLVGLGGGAHAVGAGAEEFVQHVVFIGGQHQLADGQAHHAGDMAGTDVAEVARGHGKVHEFWRGLDAPCLLYTSRCV